MGQPRLPEAGIAGNADDKTDIATVTITVSPEIDANAVNDSFKVNEDTIRTPLDVLKNDVDPEGDSFKVTGVTQGSKGIVEIGVNGANVLYTPDPNFVGTDSFTYTITDSTGASDTATVTVEVIDVAEPPDAVDDAATVIEDSPPNVIDVRANDKLAHLAAYAVLMAMAVQLIQRRAALLGAAVVLVLLGAGLELAQGAFTARREADALDALANLLGVGLGASLALTRAATWLQRLLPR